MSGNFQEKSIKVVSNGRSIHFPLNVHGNLNLSFLLSYFPGVVGLSYEDGDESHDVPIIDGQLIINSNFEVYKVRIKIMSDFFLRVEGDLTAMKHLLIRKYHRKGYSYSEIIDFLASRHQLFISLRQLKRVLKTLGLRRRGMPESPLDEIVTAILKELHESGSCLGYKRLWQRLRQTYGFYVKRSTILQTLRILDPEGIEQRKIHRLRKRKYTAPGPNFLWHIDGYDKLKRFGIAIHGCIDGYSRKILWLEVASSNNNPYVIAYYYLKTVKNLKFIPKVIRSDQGTENSVIENLQIALRFHHIDGMAGFKSYIKGKSTSNQRIESYWGQMRRSGVDFWISFFKDMCDNGLFDNSKKLHVVCLRYCFGPLIKYELQMTCKEWNRHCIRKQRNCETPTGRPDHLFYCPNKFGSRDFQKPVNLEDIDTFLETHAVEPELIDTRFAEIVEILIPDVREPISVEEALKLYGSILEALDNNTDENLSFT